MDFTNILNALALLGAAIITAYIIPWIKSKTTADQQADINKWVKIAVVAAEQLFQGAGKGADKKQYVVDFLAAHGVTLDSDRVNALIEAAVYQLKNGVIPVE